MLVGIFLMFESEVVHGVILVKAATLNALDHFLPVDMVLPVDDLDDLLLHQDALTFEVDEVRAARLKAEAELRSLQVPQLSPALRLHKDRTE